MTEPATQWLTAPEVADALGIPVGRVRRLLEDRHLLAVRVDGVLKIPASFLQGGEPLPGLHGTLVLLNDNRYSDDEAMAWLLERDATLEEAPIEALRRGHKAAVRRVAQALA